MQRITVTQTAHSEFNTKVGTTDPYEYTFAAQGDDVGVPQEVTYTNTRKPSSVEVHVAQVNVSTGSISLQDGWRSGTNSFTLELGEEKEFNTALPAANLVIEQPAYGFGAVFYGTDDDSAVTPVGPMTAVSVAWEPETEGGNVYDLYLKDADGNRLTALGSSYRVYYLYYPKLTVRYMKEGDNGVLTAIQGSTDRSTVVDTITYGGAALTMNGQTVTQDQKVEMPPDGLTITQTVGSGSFNMPPLLDDGVNQYDLVYSKIGALAESSGSGAITNVSDLDGFISEDQTLYMKIVNNSLSWSFVDEPSQYQTIRNWPVVYAIYRERGYDLTVTKTAPIDTGYTEPFTVTVSSTMINRTSYNVEGTGNSTVTATPASGSTPGTIAFTVTDGSAVKLIGLGAGSYTITETDNENYTLTAKKEGVDQTVTDNSTVTVELDGEVTVDLINTAQYICRVGNRQFYTISSAVDWIRENTTNFSGTIEMLVDYLMPSSDTPEIPDYLNIVLTSVSGTTKTITRKSTFTGGAMFTNSGSLTLRDITLDGDHVSASGAMIDNEGTLTIGSGATLTGGSNSRSGGAVNSRAGSVTVSGGTISGNSAASGGAIYASGGTVAISGGSIEVNTAASGGAIYYAGSDTVTVSGGSLSQNTAAVSGGAIYMNTGTLNVSGGSMTKNTANESGGAVYAANAVIAVSGGTIGGESNANTAQNGGAIYADIGSVTVSNGTVSYNSASQNGGAIYANTASVTMSGGTLDHNAAANGGAVYALTGAVTVSKGNITNNSATGNGGGSLPPTARKTAALCIRNPARCPRTKYN